MTPTDRVAEAILIGLVLLAPLPLGSVPPPAVVALAALTAAAAWLVLPRRGLRFGAGSIAPWLPAFIFAGFFAALVPLPAFLVRLLSPSADALRAGIPGDPGGGWATLSLHPEASRFALAKVALYATLFLVAAALARGAVPRRVLGAFVISGLFQSVYGCAEYLSGRQRIFWHVKRYYLEDATGTFINKNHFAGLLELALPVGIGFLLLGLRREDAVAPRPGLRAGLLRLAGEEGARVMVLAVVIALLALGLMFSHSRSGLVAACVAVLAVVGAARRRLGTPHLRPLLLAAGGVLLAALLLGGIDRAVMGPTRLAAGVSLDRGRIPVWLDSLSIVARYPVFGTGLGTFEDIYPLHRTESGGFLYDHAHNDYLELAVEAGIPAALGALVLVAWFGRRVVRGLALRRSEDFPLLLGAAGGVGALLLHEVTDFNLQIPANASLFAILAGSLAGALASGRPGLSLIGNGPATVRSGAPPSRMARAGGLAIACLATIALVQTVRNDRALSRFGQYLAIAESGEQAAGAGVGELKQRLLREAIAWGGVSARAHAALALERARGAGDAGAGPDGAPADRAAAVRSALSEVREGLEANPTEPDAWLAGLRIAALASLGGGPVAEPRALAAQYLEGALRSDPLSGHLRRRIARILLSTGDQAGAVEQYRLAMRDASVDREETVRQMLEQGIAPEEIVGAVPARFEDVYAAGVALVVAGHPEAAEGTFLAAAKLDPSSHLPWLSLSRLKEVEGRHRESLEDATAALGRFPSLDAGARAELLFAAAIASAALGEPREALARAREALNITPRVAPLRDLAGRMLFATGDARGAIDEWSYILENLPGDPWLSENREGLHKRLGTAFEALGLRAKALDHWLEALRLAPKDPEARLAIERLSGNG